MASKWADYGIHAVRYDEENEYIEKVRIKKDKGDKFGESKKRTREEVLDMMSEGETFVTIIWSEEDESWSKGAPVNTIRVDGETYLRTDRDKTKADNLGELPSF